jgi:DNA-binding NarL/FixJ family response regulator
MKLTKRQSEILTLIASGHTMKQSADKMGTNFQSAYVHFGHIKRKLKLRDFVHATHYALHHKIVENIFDSGKSKS